MTKTSQRIKLYSTQWMHFAVMFFICAMVGVGGLKLTSASFADSSTSGKLVVFAYEGGIADSNKLGGVAIALDNNGHSSGCTPAYSSNVTSGAQGETMGRVTFNCVGPVRASDITYKFSGAAKDGYHLSPNSPHPAGDTFHIRNGDTTTLSIVMDKDPDPTPAAAPAADPTPDPTPAPTPTHHTDTPVADIPANDPVGVYEIIAEDADNGNNKLDNVTITVAPGGSNVPCNDQVKTTGNDGRVSFRCVSARDGGSREYTFVSAMKSGYHMAAGSPHQPGDKFTVTGGNTKTVHITLKKDAVIDNSPAPSASPAPSSTPTPTTPTPSTTKPSTSTSQPAPTENQYKGAAMVTTYEYNDNGTKTRLGGVNVHTQAVGSGGVPYAVNDTAHNCNDYNQTTDTSDNSNRGQASFYGCWTGAGRDHSQVYQLSYSELPAGYFFKSFSITDGPDGAKFISGKSTSTDGIGEQFNIHLDVTTRLELVLYKPKANQAPVKPSEVQQVVTQNGTRYVAADDSDAAKKAATVLNTATANGNDPGKALVAGINSGGKKDDGGSDDDSDDDGDDSDDTPPPTMPQNFKAVEDDGGSVTLSWSASTSSNGSPLLYYVSRDIKNAPLADGPELVANTDDGIPALSAVDTHDNIQYPQTYIYYVEADDADSNASDSATVEITVTAPVTNVSAAPAAPSSTDDTDDGTETTASTDQTTVTSLDQQGSISIPNGSTSENLACSVNDDSSVGSDLTSSIGVGTGTIYQPVCRDDNGDTDNDFTQDVDESVSVDDSDIGDDADLYAYDGTDWNLISTDDQDDDDTTTAPDTQSDQTDQDQKVAGSIKYTKATRVKHDGKTTFTIKTKHPVTLTLIRKQNHVNPAAPVTTILLVLLTAVGVREVIRRRFDPNFFELAYDAEDVADTAAPVLMTPSAIDPTVVPVTSANYVMPDHQRSYVIQAPQQPIQNPEEHHDNPQN